METIYVLSEYDFNDHSIMGVFTDKDLAISEAKRLYRKNRDFYIEEYGKPENDINNYVPQFQVKIAQLNKLFDWPIVSVYRTKDDQSL